MKVKAADSIKANKKTTKPRKHKKRSRAAKARRRRRVLASKYSRGPEFGKASHYTKLKNRSHPSVNFRFFPMSGNCFWMNYSNVFQWRDHHLLNNYSPYSLIGQPRFPSPAMPQNPGDSLPSISGCTKPYKSSPKGAGLHFENNEPIENVASEEDSSEDGIVVTEELMQFLEINMRHKASLRRKKESKKEDGEKKSQESERDAVEDCQRPLEEEENEKRLREMAILYGEDAPMIHGMETALQLSFNRQVDIFNPSYWPIHPFSIQYNDRTSLAAAK